MFNLLCIQERVRSLLLCAESLIIFNYNFTGNDLFLKFFTLIYNILRELISKGFLHN